MTLGELGERLKVAVQGAPGYEIQGVRDVERLSPEQPLEDHWLYFIENPAVLKRHPRAAESGAVLTVEKLKAGFPLALVAPDAGARLVFISLLKLFDKTPSFEPGIQPGAIVHRSARVDPKAAILPGVVVMEGASVGPGCILYPGAVLEPFAEVGEGTVLYPGVVIGHHCVIGKGCILHGATVIGADGFGFYDGQGGRHKIPQIGNVVIGDHVEIGASCTVDRATIESTTIGEHTKIDDQVHIGHNCRVGRFIYIVGNSALGGSVVVEDGVMISGMVIVKDHVRMAKGSVVMGLSGVAQDTEPGAAYFGSPARPARQMHKMNAALERLPELLVRVRALEAKPGAQG
ncbi:MAG TPA: UDP-3-O-(3-hydroxymyristoyl)glucosamine N-acyltransferase [Elusimicrobia bacterium]|nr:UDP-3-O-(3-hydroxymyristoyl)glucosamine N-acyltransferase [Elusimicrobiota bacterium]